MVSQYSSKYHFARLNSYQLSQWTDVLSSRFVNWFTIPTTSTKYILMGRQTMAAGTYQLILKNVSPTSDDFTKTLIVSEVNTFGTTNHLLGFTLFAYGLVMLLVHVGLCCKSRRQWCTIISLYYENKHILHKFYENYSIMIEIMPKSWWQRTKKDKFRSSLLKWRFFRILKLFITNSCIFLCIIIQVGSLVHSWFDLFCLVTSRSFLWSSQVLFQRPVLELLLL